MADNPPLQNSSTKSLNTRLPAHLHKRIRLNALERGLTVQALSVEVWQEYFWRRAMPKSFENFEDAVDNLLD